MKLEIRKMKPDDRNQVSRIYDEGTDSGNANFEVTLPPWDEWIQKQVPGCSIVAIKSDDIIGWGSLAVYSEREVYSGVVEDSVYVTKEYRRNGVGDILLEKLIELSEENVSGPYRQGYFQKMGKALLYIENTLSRPWEPMKDWVKWMTSGGMSRLWKDAVRK